MLVEEIFYLGDHFYAQCILAEKEQHTTSDHGGKGKKDKYKKKELDPKQISGQGGRDAGGCEQLAGKSEREKPRAVI